MWWDYYYFKILNTHSLASQLALDFIHRFKNSVFLYTWLFEKPIGIQQEFRTQLKDDSSKGKYLAVKDFKNLSCWCSKGKIEVSYLKPECTCMVDAAELSNLPEQIIMRASGQRPQSNLVYLKFKYVWTMEWLSMKTACQWQRVSWWISALLQKHPHRNELSTVTGLITDGTGWNVKTLFHENQRRWSLCPFWPWRGEQIN